MPVSELARTYPIAETRKTPILTVAELMRDEDVGSVIIIEDDRPVGIVTDRDITVKVTAEGTDPADVTAENIMTPDPETIARDAGLMELTQTMANNGVRRIPVVDDDGNLDGIITLDDVSRLLSDEQQNIADVIESESPPY